MGADVADPFGVYNFAAFGDLRLVDEKDVTGAKIEVGNVDAWVASTEMGVRYGAVDVIEISGKLTSYGQSRRSPPAVIWTL